MKSKFSIFINYLCLSAFLFIGCGKDYYELSDFREVQKIDAHVHINTSNNFLVDQAVKDNFKLLTINVDYPDFPPIEEQQKISLKLINSFPDHLAFASTFRMNGWDKPGWVEKTIKNLDSTFRQGAVAVKVWKNIGMSFKDKDSSLVMIDNPKFDPVFSFIKEKNKVLIGHQGEPKDCWLPFDQMIVNGDKEYFKTHPQYYMYLFPEMPSYEKQMQVRDRMLEKNKNVIFMGAHLASLEWSIDELSKFFERFPNASADMAARMGQIQYQTISGREKVRDFFVKYQDRILYATDLTHDSNITSEEMKKAAHDKWLSDWKFLTTDSLMTSPDLNNSFVGLKLSKYIVDKIYRKNAERLFSEAWRLKDK